MDNKDVFSFEADNQSSSTTPPGSNDIPSEEEFSVAKNLPQEEEDIFAAFSSGTPEKTADATKSDGVESPADSISKGGLASKVSALFESKAAKIGAGFALLVLSFGAFKAFVYQEPLQEVAVVAPQDPMPPPPSEPIVDGGTPPQDFLFALEPGQAQQPGMPNSTPGSQTDFLGVDSAPGSAPSVPVPPMVAEATSPQMTSPSQPSMGTQPAPMGAIQQGAPSVNQPAQMGSPSVAQSFSPPTAPPGFTAPMVAPQQGTTQSAGLQAQPTFQPDSGMQTPPISTGTTAQATESMKSPDEYQKLLNQKDAEIAKLRKDLARARTDYQKVATASKKILSKEKEMRAYYAEKSGTSEQPPAKASAVNGFSIKAIVEGLAWVNTASGSVVPVRPGDSIGGARVVSIDPVAMIVKTSSGEIR